MKEVKDIIYGTLVRNMVIDVGRAPHSGLLRACNDLIGYGYSRAKKDLAGYEKEMQNSPLAVRNENYPDAYLHVNRERPDMRGVSLSHDESGYNTHYDTFPLYRHPAPGWQPIETAPKGQRILVVTEKRVPFFAKYILPRTHKASTAYDSPDWADHDEEEDVYWCPEGWYYEQDCEQCEIDWRQYGGMPLIYWMPAPEVPE